ncbi:MAG: ABC transporter permease [bacterium]
MKDSSIRYYLRVVWARAYVRVVGAQRELSWIVGDTVLPFLTLAGYIYVYRGLNAPPQYTGFVVLGGIMMAFWMHNLWSMGMQFFWEKEVGNLERFLITPMPRTALLLGMAVGGMIMTSSRALIIYLASRFWFGVEFPIDKPWLTLAIFLTTLSALYGLGMAFSSLFFIAGRSIYNLIGILGEPIFFLGGFFFPVRYLGLLAYASAALIPLTLGLDALRQTALGAYSQGLLPPVTELKILLGVAVVFIIIAFRAIGVLEAKGRIEGTLILKNQ